MPDKKVYALMVTESVNALGECLTRGRLRGSKSRAGSQLSLVDYSEMLLDEDG
ncbi:hypothetical protein NXC14_PA00236 (plasmid) [Rhizobium sp. NXC14]|nr:hypothetical protein NXC14_PA00236 [Rhizobium sp. NXC14]